MLNKDTLHLFTGSWCSPCMTLKRTLDNAKIRYTLIGVDTDDGVNIATANGVKSVPTLIYNGKRLTGVCNEATVRKLMEVEE